MWPRPSSRSYSLRGHEPRLALAAGPEGLDVIQRLIRGSAAALRPGGTLILEIAFGMERAVKALLAASSLTWETTEPDLQGIPRVVIAHG